MKSLIRQAATLCLVGSTLLGSGLIQARQAFALPTEQVLQKLAPVLVYTVVAVDDKKKEIVPLTANIKQGDKSITVGWVFFSPEDAQKFIDSQKQGLNALKTKDPTTAEEQLKILNVAQVVPDSLARFYDVAVKSKDSFKIQFMPIEQQVKSAIAMNKQFTGVPLFRANFGQNRYGTAFFLSKEDLQNELTELKKTKPDLAKDATIEVIPLEGLIEVMSTQNNEDLKKIQVLPPLESRKLYQQIIEQVRQQQSGDKTKAPSASTQPPAPKSPAKN
jgi:hypothetical protein